MLANLMIVEKFATAKKKALWEICLCLRNSAFMLSFTLLVNFPKMRKDRNFLLQQEILKMFLNIEKREFKINELSESLKNTFESFNQRADSL